MTKQQRILAIETSCDDTGIALVECSGTAKAPKFKVLQNLVSSQIKIHRPFGGVVPNLAKREHIKNLPLLWQRIMNNELRIKGKTNRSIIHNSKFIIPKIDAIAVTVGPGLEPALWTGINFAEELAKTHKKKLIGANHMEGHLYSFLLTQKTVRDEKLEMRNKNMFPAVALVVSGGHTILLLLKDLTHWKKLGETRDDAAGEAFDKVARLLDLPYPGGPEIEKLAKKGNPNAIAFPRPMLHPATPGKNYDFSFSGLKTSVLYYLRDHEGIMNNELRIKGKTNRSIIHNSKFIIPNKADVAASFQQAALDVLIAKTTRAARDHGARSVILCGGVAANKPLRAALGKEAKKMGLDYFVPDFEYNNDNAAMIAAAAYVSTFRKTKLPLKARGDLNI